MAITENNWINGMQHGHRPSYRTAPMRKLSKRLREEALIYAVRRTTVLDVCHFCICSTNWILDAENGVLPLCNAHMPKITAIPYVAYRFFLEEVEHQRTVKALEEG